MKKFGLLTTLLIGSLLLIGCNKTVVENCGDDCINESDIDVLEHKCMEYVNNAMFYNIEASASRTDHYFYDNSGSMEYTFTDAEFSGTYYGIKGYVKAGDISSNFICNIYTGGLLHGLHFYNDKSNNEEPIEECKRYFDGCNRCTKQDDGERICTEEACEQYQETYCADEQYDKFLEDIKSSNELELYHNAQYGIQLGLSEELNGGKIIEEDKDDMFPHHLIIFMAKDDTATADETGIDGYREKFTVWVVPVENYEDAMIGFTEDNILGKNNKYYFFESKPDPLDTNYYYINMFVENVK